MSGKINKYDYVGFYRENSDKYEYGIVLSYNKNKKEYEIKPYGERKSIFFPKAALTYLPPKKLSSDDIRKILRYECTYAEFTSDIIPEYNFVTADDEVEYDLEDLTEMIKNLIAKAPNKPLKSTDYNSKKLELVLPDMPMTAKQAEVINSFIEDFDMSVVIVKG